MAVILESTKVPRRTAVSKTSSDCYKKLTASSTLEEALRSTPDPRVPTSTHERARSTPKITIRELATSQARQVLFQESRARMRLASACASVLTKKSTIRKLTLKPCPLTVWIAQVSTRCPHANLCRTLARRARNGRRQLASFRVKLAGDPLRSVA